MHADTPELDEIRLFAASLAHDPDGIELPYLVLDHVATRHRLRDAVLVLRPSPMGPQIFCRGRVPVTPAAVADLLARPVGLYTIPDELEPTARAALAGICNLALAALSMRRSVAIDEVSGLASTGVIDAALTRAAASSSRYGWSFTAIMLATAGEGTADERWAALSRATADAARVGDEVGVGGPGRAVAILGNAGADVVRPFVARVRAALSAAGAKGVDLHAATVTSPLETVDPEAIWALLNERLDELVGQPARDAFEHPGEVPGPGRGQFLPGGLELALRSLPGVISVGTADHPSGVGYQIDVVALEASEALSAVAARRAREHRIDAPVVVVPCSGAPARAATPAPAPRTGQHPGNGDGPVATASVSAAGGNGAAASTIKTAAPPAQAARPTSPAPTEHLGGNGHAPIDVTVTATNGNPEPIAQLSATGSPAVERTSPATPSPAGVPASAAGPTALDQLTGDRVLLVSAAFDPDTGTSEVQLSLAGTLGIGRASVGPLAGGAQATLAALSALGIAVPYYLVSAERAHSVPGEPVVVVLAPRRAAEPTGSLPPAERIGVAQGPDDAGASSRATLSALNRFLGAATADPAALASTGGPEGAGGAAQ